MTDKYNGEERRHHEHHEQHGIVRYIAPILQAVVLAGILWLGSTVQALQTSVVKMEVRYESSQASGTRVENDVAAIRNQLSTMSSAILTGSHKIENLEQRVKGLEFVKERLR